MNHPADVSLDPVTITLTLLRALTRRFVGFAGWGHPARRGGRFQFALGEEDFDLGFAYLADHRNVFGVPCSCPEGATGESQYGVEPRGPRHTTSSVP